MLLAQPGHSWFVPLFCWTWCDGCSDTTHHAGLPGKNLLGSGGAGCAWSIPGAAALLGRIFPKPGCLCGWGQQIVVLGGFWLVQRQLYNHKTRCCCLSVSTG